MLPATSEERKPQSTNGNQTTRNGTLPYYRWEEISEHASKSSRWIVIEGAVYDVTSWSQRHPGGTVLLGQVAGQDATEAFRAFHHNSLDSTRKYLRPLLIGYLAEGEEEEEDSQLKQDFEELRQTAQRMGLFDASLWFFGLMFLHFILLLVASYLVLLYWGTGWRSCALSVLLYSTFQVQSDWYQHDIGHLSVFKKSSWNRLYHMFIFCFLKGVSARWWNHLHYQHHSKPNVINKDPDIKLDVLFLLGEKMPIQKAQTQTSKTVPYNRQHTYFSFIMPPLLFPVYFQFMNWRHVVKRREYTEALLILACVALMLYFYVPVLGFWGFLLYFETCRVVESIWFTWVSQSNHIPMAVDNDAPRGGAWFRNQLSATCNVEKSPFNDWFTGHLNFQIEHHLFPQMPRHNYYKVAPLVKSLCEKHGVEYKVKTLGGAFADILRSLRKSGQLWLHAYEELHGST